MTDKVVSMDTIRVQHTLDRLDAIAEGWAKEVNLEGIAANLAKQATPESIEAMLRQAFVEGHYRGERS